VQVLKGLGDKHLKNVRVFCHELFDAVSTVKKTAALALHGFTDDFLANRAKEFVGECASELSRIESRVCHNKNMQILLNFYYLEINLNHLLIKT
jgi:hypothetical protein